MKISEKGIEFIIKEEGEVLTAYTCPAGVLTIGIGHTGKDVKEGMKITKEQSRELLKNDLIRFENSVSRSVKVNLTQNQFDALVSFAFKTGSIFPPPLFHLLNCSSISSTEAEEKEKLNFIRESVK